MCINEYINVGSVCDEQTQKLLDRFLRGSSKKDPCWLGQVYSY